MIHYGKLQTEGLKFGAIMRDSEVYDKFINRKYIKNLIKIECLYSAFESNYSPDFYFGGEFHQAWEMVYIITGSVGSSGDNRIYHLNEGDIIFHKPMEFHRIWAVDNIKPHLFVMSFYPAGKLPKMFENGVFTLNDAQKEKLFELLNFLKKYSSYENKTGSVTYFLVDWEREDFLQNVANRLEGFLLSVSDHEKKANTKQEDTSKKTQLYKKIVTVLTENIYSNITISEIAKRCNVSVSQLKRVFVSKSHIGIHKYYLRLKIAEAMKLFAEGLTVGEVAEQLEFSSSNYFSEVFKKETGITPTEYKKYM